MDTPPTPDAPAPAATAAKDVRQEVFPERMVQPDRVKVYEDAKRKLCISIDGKEFTDLSPRRVFPLTDRADYVSFTNCDRRETVMLAHPHTLDVKSREVLDRALARMYYTATIVKVYSVTEKMGVGQWQVQTDRGFATFEVPDRETIRRLPEGRIILADADGNRFEIRHVADLDERSRKLVESEI